MLSCSLPFAENIEKTVLYFFLSKWLCFFLIFIKYLCTKECIPHKILVHYVFRQGQSYTFGQTKNRLVSGRLACISSKTEILNKIGISILILTFQVN